ncbi:MAG: hypothetical protein HGA31_05570 [Candidatus Moranbacteria bacterium]|nr:hypothetical protein [Candidatus Moranbacteria bacterium]
MDINETVIPATRFVRADVPAIEIFDIVAVGQRQDNFVAVARDKQGRSFVFVLPDEEPLERSGGTITNESLGRSSYSYHIVTGTASAVTLVEHSIVDGSEFEPITCPGMMYRSEFQGEAEVLPDVEYEIAVSKSVDGPFLVLIDDDAFLFLEFTDSVAEVMDDFYDADESPDDYRFSIVAGKGFAVPRLKSKSTR